MVLHPNDDDPAVAAPEPYLPLTNDDLTEPSPVPFPPPKEPSFDFEPNFCRTASLICGSAPPPNFSNFYNSHNISNPPPDQSVSSSEQKKRRHIISRIGQKSSSNNNLDLKGHVMVKVRTTTPADIIKLENNTRIIPEEEAVCRFCFHQLFPVNDDVNNNNNNNNNNKVKVLKAKCLCPFTLTHQHCATEWSGKKGNTKCDVCDQDTNYIPVTLSTPIPSTSGEKPDKGSFISTLKKWSCF